jgi:ubiquitin conjugation factor E4 B
MDRIDPVYHGHSTRLDYKEETRIKATSEEATNWAKEVVATGRVSIVFQVGPLKLIGPLATPPNFISDIFYLSLGLTHYGYLQTIRTYDELGRHLDDMQRHLDMLQGDGSWIGVSWWQRVNGSAC